MKKELQFMVFCISIGVSLVAYGYTNFASKSDFAHIKELIGNLRDEFKMMRSDLKRLDKRLYDSLKIHRSLKKEEK